MPSLFPRVYYGWVMVGTALAIKALRPSIRVIGAEPAQGVAREPAGHEDVGAVAQQRLHGLEVALLGRIH